MKQVTSILFSVIFFTANYINGQVEIKLIESYELLQKDELLLVVSDIVVTEDEIVIVSDGKAGDLKFYNNKGNLIKILGRKGYGPDEFINPKVFDYVSSKLVINDWGRHKVYIYERIKPSDFKKSTDLLGSFYDIKMMKNQLLISGPKLDPNGVWFHLFIKDPEGNNVKFLLTDEEILGQPRSKKSDTASNKVRELYQVGVRFYCDFFGNYVYSIWQGNLSILKTNINTLETFRFGVKTDNYTTPKSNKNLAKARKEQNLKSYYKELGGMSLIRKIFVTGNFVGVIFMNYDDELSMWKPILQLYSHEGKLLTERLITEAFYTNYLMGFYYDKNKNILFALSQTIDDKFNIFYKINKYKISE
jgi:hypothetical protein